MSAGPDVEQGDGDRKPMVERSPEEPDPVAADSAAGRTPILVASGNPAEFRGR